MRQVPLVPHRGGLTGGAKGASVRPRRLAPTDAVPGGLLGWAPGAPGGGASRALGASGPLLAAGAGREATGERNRQEALSGAQEVKAIGNTQTAVLHLTFIQGNNRAASFTNIFRCGITIERWLCKAARGGQTRCDIIHSVASRSATA